MYTEYFKEQVGRIIEVIGEHGGELHQDDFDKEFKSFGEKPGGLRKDNYFGIPPLGCFLGSINNADKSWSMWLDLTQHMVKEGIIGIEGELPNVRYLWRRS